MEHRGCTVRKISPQCVSPHIAEEKKQKSQAVDPKMARAATIGSLKTSSSHKHHEIVTSMSAPFQEVRFECAALVVFGFVSISGYGG